MAVRAADVGPLTRPLIAGRYAPGEPLGSGGAAVVLRGWDVREERAVALKSPHREDMDGVGMDRETEPPCQRPVDAVPLSALRWRIEREGRIMAALSHPHIARVYDYFEVEGWPWLALELVEGRDLWRVTRERGPLSPLSALAVGRQMCAALAAIHAAGMFHRDVKPRNIILAPDGHATLIDFDLAWSPALRDDSEPDMVYGTPEYMAPEQAMGERITAATDIYSLGVTLYELLAGRAPFHASTASAVMWRHVTETPPPLREWRRDLPAPVERVVMRALAKEPRRRYPSAEAMARALALAEGAAPLASSHYGWRAQPALAPRAADTLAPVPAVERPAPTPPQVGRQRNAQSTRWLILTFWTLALIGLSLSLIFFAILSQILPT